MVDVARSAAILKCSCGSSRTRTLGGRFAVAGASRVECGGCGRFLGWDAGEEREEVREVVVSPVEPPPVTTPVVEARILEPVAPAPTTATTTPPLTVPVPPPPAFWLYVSKRLDIEWFPNHPLWSAETVTVRPAAVDAGKGERSKSPPTSPPLPPPSPPPPTVYYRLTPTVVAWLEAAGTTLERGFLTDKVSRDQLDAYLAAMVDVWAFAGEVFAPGEVEAVKRAVKATGATGATGGAAVVELPEVVTGPMDYRE